MFYQRVDVGFSFLIRNLHQHHVPGETFDQCRNVGVFRIRYEIPFPVSGGRAIFNRSRALTDRYEIRDLPPTPAFATCRDPDDGARDRIVQVSTAALGLSSVIARKPDIKVATIYSIDEYFLDLTGIPDDLLSILHIAGGAWENLLCDWNHSHSIRASVSSPSSRRAVRVSSNDRSACSSIVFASKLT